MHRLIFLVFLFTGACSQSPLEDCFVSTGPPRTKIISLSGSPKVIEVFDNLNVTWHLSDSNIIRLTCGRNLLNKIGIGFNGEKLELRNNAKCNWVRDYKKPIQLDLYSKSPSQLWLRGFGNFNTKDTIKTDIFWLVHYGAGKGDIKVRANSIAMDFNTYGHLKLSGEGEEAIIFALKEGKLDASQLKLKNMNIQLEGLNTINAWVIDSIRGIIKSKGKLYYKGNPFIKAKAPDLNQFIPLN